MKIIGTCPACSRNIEQGDDVAPYQGKTYHEECVPAAEPTPALAPPSQPESLVESKKEKKMSKDEMMMALIQQMTALTQKVAELESRPATAAAAPAARKPKSEKGAPRPDVFYVIKGFPSEKFPPQCLKVYRAIAQATPESGKMTEVDIWNALMVEAHPSTKASKSVGSWNYRQTPFYIFKYYRQDMIAAEYVLGPFDAV